jgi:thymidylate kinase
MVLDMKLIVLEGIDGSGKTTLLQKLKKEFQGENNIEFIKSPINPFRDITGDFWHGDTFERFIFFLCSNSYFSKTIDKNKVYVLDRFIYSTLVTHLNTKDSKENELKIAILKRMNIVCPTITFLVHTSKEEIKRRLKERNNNIDNALDLDELYSCYYEFPLNLNSLFGEIEIILNESEGDLETNTQRIRDKILELQNSLH